MKGESRFSFQMWLTHLLLRHCLLSGICVVAFREQCANDRLRIRVCVGTTHSLRGVHGVQLSGEREERFKHLPMNKDFTSGADPENTEGRREGGFGAHVYCHVHLH